MTKIIQQKNLKQSLKQIKVKRKTALAGGCFDILHTGHTFFFKNIKKKARFLIILLESDQTVNKIKGKTRPIFSQDERAEILSSINEIDLIINLSPLLSDRQYDSIVKIIKPDIIAITENDPIKIKKEKQANQIGAQILEIKEKKGASTSKIIDRIKNEL